MLLPVRFFQSIKWRIWDAYANLLKSKNTEKSRIIFIVRLFLVLIFCFLSFNSCNSRQYQSFNGFEQRSATGGNIRHIVDKTKLVDTSY